MEGSAIWGPVTVTWARTSRVDQSGGRRIAVLGPTQLARYRALEGRSAVRFALSRILLAEAIETVAGPGADLRVSTTCERCGAEHGRVRHAAGLVALSVSYAGDLVAVAAADMIAATGVGVDIEVDDADERQRAAELGPLFDPAPPPSVEEWTRIEAVLKADGRGLRVSPSAVTFSALSGTAEVPGRRQALDIATISGPVGYVLSVAVVPAEAVATSEARVSP